MKEPPRKGGMFNAKRYGYRGYINPVNRSTGQPIGRCINSNAWCKKYFYTRAQLVGRCHKRQILGLRHKGRFYVLDAPPEEHITILCNGLL